MDILESTSVYEEETPEIQQWAEQDFTEEYGIKLSVPSDWYINPEYYSELPTLVLKFEVAKGNNIIRVEYGTEDKEGYQQRKEKDGGWKDQIPDDLLSAAPRAAKGVPRGYRTDGAVHRLAITGRSTGILNKTTIGPGPGPRKNRERALLQRRERR